MKRLMDWLSALTLRTKLLLSIVACLLIPSIIAVNISGYWTRDAMRVQAGVSGQQALNVSNIFISNMMNNMIYITNNIQQNANTRTMLRTLGSGTPSHSDLVIEGKRINEMIETMVYSKEGMYLTILLPNGYYFTNYSGDEYNPKNFFKAPWFEKFHQQSMYDVFWFGGQPSYIQSRSTESPTLITLARTLKFESKEPFAYIIMSLEEREIGTFLQSYAETQELFLINETGTILSHGNASRLSEKFSYFDAVTSNEPKLIERDGEEMLVQAQTIKMTNWKLVSMMPYKQAVEQIQSFRRTDFLIQLTAIAAFVLVLVYLVRQFTAPLRTLSQVALRIEMGDLSVRSNIRGQDEVGKLSYVFDRMLGRIQSMIEQVKEEQARKRNAELKMLQAQINPHFLFNTLNSIRMKIFLKGDGENAEMLSSLSTLLRMTIHMNETISLHDEVETVRHYVKLMRLRQKEPVEFVANLASNTLLDMVPRFTIQPVIENSLIHGLKYKGGMITVNSWHQEGKLTIEIIDDGVGIPQDQVERMIADMKDPNSVQKHQGMSGLGLSNVYERLKLLYGDEVEVAIESELGQGTRTRLTFPITNSELTGDPNV